MIGAIIGDIAGSRFEFDRSPKTVDGYEIYDEECCFTDDTVMTIGVAEGLMDAVKDADVETIKKCVIRSMRKYGKRYPDAGYGGRFFLWVLGPEAGAKPYNSYGNGSAMRVSPVGWLYDSPERTREVARATAEVSHNHPEGIKGAESVAAAIYMARTGSSREEIKEYVEREFGYDMSRTCDEIRPAYHHVESCQETVPQAFAAFLEGDSFEGVVRLAISLGGDCDTLTDIAAAMAEAYFGVPEELKEKALTYLPEDLKEVLKKFQLLYGQSDKRYEKGDVGKIIDRMIAALEEKAPDGANEEIKPGRYRHFKGREYEVLFTAQHSETEEQMVVYRALYGERKIWVRPVSMWNEVVEVNGERKKRFEYLPPKHYLFALQDYFEENGLAGTSPIDTAVAARKAGKQYSLSDHIRGLVYSMLTSQTVWKSVAPKLPEIDRVFHDYDPEWLKSASADDLIKAVFDLKCGNRSTAAQIKALPKNIAVFERIEKRYGSMDAFVTSQPPASIVEMLSESSSPYKLAQVGKALAWEYIRNVGVDGAKPDTHLRRFLSSRRMGTGRNADCTIDEVLTQVNALSVETGLSQATIDYLIWTFCASKHFEICSSTPHCERCPLSEYCNYSQRSQNKN